MTKLPTATLVRSTIDVMSAEALIALCARHRSTLPRIGFAYTSAAATFFEVLSAPDRDPVLHAPSIEERMIVELAHIFELRLFNERIDLHWVRKGATGHLTVLVERDQSGAWKRCWRQLANLRPFASLKALILEQSDVEWQDHEYLVWGDGVSNGDISEGWDTTSCARIGPLHVPIALSKGQRAVIRAREYFAKKKQGNVCFVGERLLGLAAFQ
mgnify:CR=1 FL=1